MTPPIRRERLLSLLLCLGASLPACSDPPTPRCDADCEARTPGSQEPGPTSAEPEAPSTPAKPDGPETSTAPETPEVAGAVDVPSEIDAPDTAAEVSAPQLISDRKVDLLLMVDNSLSMRDKAELLGKTAADFVAGLVDPACVDAAGNRSKAASPELSCPPGQAREFLPVRDINIAVISSSLGDAGANVACREGERDDRAHSIGSLPRGEGHGTNGAGVLELRADSDLATVQLNLQGVIDSVGQAGCGWEMSLESWYRFLAEPFPYAQLERVSCTGDPAGPANCVQPTTDDDGRVLLDSTLLEQRAAFLRPDSLLAILMLSDENDCSLQVGGQSWIVTAIDDQRPMFRGSSACDTNPNDACCYSCPLGAPPGCTADPICNADPETGSLQNRLPSAADGQNLRCFEQKRRFGVDFLYPTQRYINALSQRELCPSAPDLSADNCAASLVPNPLLVGRDPNSIFLSGIVGVPWQEIASAVSAAGQPLPAGELRFKSPSELKDDAWDALVGSSTASPPLLPTIPFMRESTVPRAGVTSANPINGREYDTATSFTPDTADDLQYACIFPLSEPRDCGSLDPTVEACDCYPGDSDRPLCEQTPGESAASTTQFFAKAYPGLRQLEVLRGHGPNAAIASICARNVSDESRSDFGYRPAMAALLERMQPQLQQ